MALRNDLRVRIDAEFPGESSFKSAEASAKLLARELQKVEDAQRSMAAAEFAAYREGEKRAADHEAAVRRMASAEIAAYREMEREAEQARAARNAAMAEVGTVAAASGAVVLAGLGLAVKGYADLEAQLSSVRAATHANAETMNQLKDAAIEAGASTVFSATEAAQAEEELAKAGVSVADILGGGLAGALDLAAAGQLEVADAAGIVAVSLGQYGLAGDQASHVADLLAAGANKAMGEVGDLANALKYVGPVAAGMNVSIEETVGTLAAFAQQGIIGEQAGTSLRGMLSSLTSPSKAASNEIDALGITLYDAQGNFLGLQNAAGELARAYGPMSDAQRDASLGVIFGNEQVTAARVLYKTGAEGVADWTAAVNDSGFAAETAAIKLDNLKGDAEKLGGALQTALVSSGEMSSGALRDVVQDATTLIDVFNEAPEAVQATVVGLGGLVGAAGAAGGAALVAVPQVTEFYNALGELGTAGKGVQRGLAAAASFLTGPWGLAVAVAVGAGALFMKNQLETKQRVDALAGSLDAQTGAITDNTRSLVAKRLEDAGALAAADRLGLSLKTVTDAALGNASALAQVNSVLAAIPPVNDLGYTHLADGSKIYASELSDLSSTVRQSIGDTEDARAAASRQAQALGEQSDAADEAGTASASAAGGVDQLGAAGEESAEAIESLGDALRTALGIFFDVETATSAAEQAVDSLTDSVKDNGTSIDLTTEKGRANAAALRERVQTSADLVAAMAREGASSEELSVKTQSLRDDFVAQMRQAGFSEEAVGQYAAAFDNIPAAVNTLIKTEGLDVANTALANILTKVEKLDGRTITTRFQTSGSLPTTGFGGAGQTVARSAGGAVRGAGSTVSDSIPALLSNDEHVWSASEVRAAGGHEAMRSMRATVLANPASQATVLVNPARQAFGGPSGIPQGPGAVQQVVSRASVMAQMNVVIGPVDASRRDEALRREASAAQLAAAAERYLTAVRERGAVVLDDLDDRQEAALQALKDRSQATEEAGQAEVDRLRKSKASDDAITAAQDRLTALKRANDVAEKALKKAQEDETDAAKVSQKQAEVSASESLTRAKDREKDATDELKDAEEELADARQRTLQLAERAADALSRRANLSDAASDFAARRSAARDAAAAQKDLDQALRDADAAGGNARGETRADALARRAQGLQALAEAGAQWAQSQRAIGADAATVEAGLSQVRSRVQALGAAYGLTAEQMAGMTDALDAQADTAPSGEELLGGLQDQLARMQETAQVISALAGAGLSSTLIDQLFEKGTDSGLATGRAILAGGSDLISRYNGVQAGIDATSRGFGSTIAAGRFAPGDRLEPQPVTLLEGARVGLATDTSVALAQGTAVGLVAGTSVGIDAPVLAEMAQRITAALATRPLVVNLDGRVVYASFQEQAAQAAIALAP